VPHLNYPSLPRALAAAAAAAASASASAADADYYTLLRFVRARNYELDKAFKMWSDSLAWRKEFDVDAILDNFVFHEREQFLMAYVSRRNLRGWGARTGTRVCGRRMGRPGEGLSTGGAAGAASGGAAVAAVSIHDGAAAARVMDTLTLATG
jgi:hypothetical protein